METLFVGSFLALPFVLFAGLTWWRRARYRRLAGELGARHEGGFFSPGAIVGGGWRVAVEKCGKRYCTRVEVAAAAPAGWCLLGRDFFRSSPDWSHARVRAQRTERAFLWEITLPGLAEPEREVQEALREWLPAGAELGRVHDELSRAKVREVLVDEGNVSVTVSGIVSDRKRIETVLAALGRLVPVRARVAARA